MSWPVAAVLIVLLLVLVGALAFAIAHGGIAAAGKFLREIFQDVDDGFSMKRAMIFVLVLALLGVCYAVVWLAIRVEQGMAAKVLDTLADLIKWLGGFITLERAPAVGRAVANVVTGRPPTPAATVVVAPVVEKEGEHT